MRNIRWKRRAEEVMRFVALIVIASALAASPKVLANGEAKPLTLKVPKAALTAVSPQHGNAPFAFPMGEPELALQPRTDLRQAQSRSWCENATTLCYDPNERRIVYKPARALMPDLPGFTRENISVKRDRIVFRYSF
jgi:hypothetical protein